MQQFFWIKLFSFQLIQVCLIQKLSHVYLVRTERKHRYYTIFSRFFLIFTGSQMNLHASNQLPAKPLNNWFLVFFLKLFTNALTSGRNRPLFWTIALNLNDLNEQNRWLHIFSQLEIWREKQTKQHERIWWIESRSVNCHDGIGPFVIAIALIFVTYRVQKSYSITHIHLAHPPIDG